MRQVHSLYQWHVYEGESFNVHDAIGGEFQLLELRVKGYTDRLDDIWVVVVQELYSDASGFNNVGAKLAEKAIRLQTEGSFPTIALNYVGRLCN